MLLLVLDTVAIATVGALASIFVTVVEQLVSFHKLSAAYAVYSPFSDTFSNVFPVVPSAHL